MKKDISLFAVFIVLVIITIIAVNSIDRQKGYENPKPATNTVKVTPTPANKKIQIQNKSNDGKNYTFIYNGHEYTAIYTTENWKIVDSYQITNKEDMKLICEALINIHPIHGKDMTSFRTVDDLVYEWEQHNIAYGVLPDDSSYKSSAKDVDLNPEDQGKSLIEFYNDRISDRIVF